MTGLCLVMMLPELLTAQEFSETDGPPATFVLVHGAWGGSWAFKEVDSIMTAHGHVFYRPALTGQGERVHLATPDIDLDTHIQDVVHVILYEELVNVVLVGHSYGGMVITGVANRIPDRIRQVVFLDAFLPGDGESSVSITGDGGARLQRMEKDGFVVPGWVAEGTPPPSDVPQSIKTFQQPVAWENPAAISLPGAYILTVMDGMQPEDDDFYSQFQRAKDRGYATYVMTSDHNPQWSAPMALVKLLEQCAGDLKD